MINIHITLTPFVNESRIIKEVGSLINHKIFESILIFALHEKGLDMNQDLIRGVEVKRIRLFSRLLPRLALFQSIKYLEFLIRIILSLLNLKPCAVNVHSVSLLPIGVLLKKAHKCKLIYDAHELETEISYKNSLRKKIAKKIERLFINSCDLVIVVSNSIADWYETEYGIQRPTVVLNVPPYRELVRMDHFRENLGIRKDQKILLYQGGLSAGRGVRLLLEAFKQRRDSSIVIVFMGYGEFEGEIRGLAERYHNIYYFPAVAPDVVLEFTSSADIGIHLIENSCLSNYFCMPNKLFECAMAGLPAVVSNMKDMSQFVIQHNMGIVVKDLSPASINQAFEVLLSGDQVIISKNSHQAAIENAWEVQEGRMLAAYRKINFSIAGSSATL